MTQPERIAFEKTLDFFYELNDEIKDELWDKASIIKYKKGDYVLNQNQVEKYITFLYLGSIRAFQLQDDDDISLDFRFSGDIITAYTSYISQKPSPVAIQALSDSIVIKIHKDSIEQLYEKHHSFEHLGRLISEYFYLRRIEREIEILSHSAEERYAKLIEKNPKLVAEIPVKFLASYIGIRKQSLSRIRAKFAKK